MADTLEGFLEAFRYRADKRGLFGGQWRVLRGLRPSGDCEDFALTALWYLADQSWWQFFRLLYSGRAQIWTGDSINGRRHACLYFEGRGWIDNIFPQWKQESGHDMRQAYSPLYVSFRLVPHWVSLSIAGALILLGTLVAP